MLIKMARTMDELIAGFSEEEIQGATLMSATIRHYINNLLNGAQGYAQLLLYTTEETDPRYGSLKEIIEKSNEIAAVTSELSHKLGKTSEEARKGNDNRLRGARQLANVFYGEISQPLQGLLECSESLLESTPEDSAGYKDVKTINEVLDRTKVIMERLQNLELYAMDYKGDMFYVDDTTEPKGELYLLTVSNGEREGMMGVTSLDELEGYSVVELEEDTSAPNLAPFILLKRNPEDLEVTRITHHAYEKLRKEYLHSGKQKEQTASLIASIDAKLKEEYGDFS